jgi:hypothetical protein
LGRRFANFEEIPDNCMTGADQGCDGDLKCICRIDNHLGSNKLFSSDCLLKDCTDGHGRKCEFSPGFTMGNADFHSILEILALAILCAGLGYFYWKSNKKAKRKTREVAILSDRVSGCGFQKYIDDLLADSANDSHGDSNSSTGTIVRHPAPTAGMQEMTAASTTTVDGVVSQSSSVYSMDTARAI